MVSEGVDDESNEKLCVFVTVNGIDASEVSCDGGWSVGVWRRDSANLRV